MALNIPINLMSVAASPAQHTTYRADPITGTGASGAIQPAASSAGARGASTDGSNGYGQGPAGQQALAAKNRQHMKAAEDKPPPDRAEPKSIVTAQLENLPGATLVAFGADTERDQPEKSPEIASDIVAPEAAPRRQSELDRFAPPDPLPTAPILLAAESYKSASKAA